MINIRQRQYEKNTLGLIVCRMGYDKYLLYNSLGKKLTDKTYKQIVTSDSVAQVSNNDDKIGYLNFYRKKNEKKYSRNSRLFTNGGARFGSTRALYFNFDMKEIAGPEYLTGAEDFCEGRAKVEHTIDLPSNPKSIFQNYETKYGFIDLNGNEVVKPIYDNVYNFRNGLARVFLGHKYRFINRNGELITKIIYDKPN